MSRLLVTVTVLLATASVRAETFVYVSVAAEKRIAVYHLDGATGRLTHRGDCPVADGEPGALAIDPARRFLFAAVRSAGKLAAFRLAPAGGRLTRQETYKVGRTPWLLAADPPGPRPVKELILPGESFLIEGRPAFVLLPPEEKRTKPQPWVLYAPTLPGLPDQHEKWMHERFLDAGVAVAGIDIGEAHGSPKGRELFTALYRQLTVRRGFAPRPCLLGRSRGGLWVASWAADHPDKVAGLAGIYPVFDLRTYPGLAKAAPAYGLTAKELEARLGEHNPIERVGALAKARVPALLIHGDEDRVVPLKENSVEFVARYKAQGAGGKVKLLVAKGQGHNYWEGFFRCQELIDFTIAQARAGKKAKATESD